MDAKKRLIQYLKLKGIRNVVFYQSTGLSNGFLDKNGNIGSDKIEKIYSAYSDLNLEWLITGNGEMLKQEGENDCLDEKNQNYLIKSLRDVITAKDETLSAKDEIIASLRESLAKQETEMKRQDFRAARLEEAQDVANVDVLGLPVRDSTERATGKNGKKIYKKD